MESKCDSSDDECEAKRTSQHEEKGTGGASVDPSEIIRLTTEYFYEEDDLSDTICSYITSSSNLEPFRVAFSNATSTSSPPEFSLECHSIYTDYLNLMESTLSSFISTLNLSMSEYISLLSQTSGESGLESGETIATGFTTLTKFENYVEMVRMYIEMGVEPMFVPPLVGEDGRFEFE
ncbi:hypothetical protein TL16_g11071 [Triparma laevis f. inornata]|uniref:BART domain-containing protein n=2 Tax=Triparma laevis TaxID=1534972 RepID=A0A9W7C3H1_9STRA|nr:hypothetical protein TL16_g11071 [Triparma laevis f. inornata]GMH99301.1 hypothetical protein TrLO_g8382 [Triparma laevis f. longispina]